MTTAFEAQKGRGRPKGSVNKSTKMLKDAILQAAEESDSGGLVGYLKNQAVLNPVAFLGLIGKVLPLQHTGADGGPIASTINVISGVPRAND